MDGTSFHKKIGQDYLLLAPEVLEKIAGLGDPLISPIVTERKLRPLVNLTRIEQGARIKKLLRGNSRDRG